MSHGADTTCAENYLSWRFDWRIKRQNPTTWSRSRRLKWLSCLRIGFFVKIKTQLHDILAISEVTRSTPSGRVLTFDSPFESLGSAFSSALRISAVRHTSERVKHFFWKWEQNLGLRIILSHGFTIWDVRTRAASDESHQFSAESRQRSGENKSAAKRPHDDDHRAPKS